MIVTGGEPELCCGMARSVGRWTCFCRPH